LLSEKFINNTIDIIKKSTLLSYGEFIIYIHLLIGSEYKSFYYFFKAYLKNKKTKEELNQYLIKKYDYNLPYFKYDIEVFPYYENLLMIKEKNHTVEDFMDLIFLKLKTLQQK
jgi:hypothetical protein